MPLKPDLSFYGLEEFVNEPIVSEPTVKKPVAKNSEAKISKEKSKAVRKNNGALIIEDWISDSEDEAESKSKIEKKTVKPIFAKIEFVKSKKQVKSPRKTTVKQGDQTRKTHIGESPNFSGMTHPSPKRNMVPKAVLMRSGLVSLTTARPVNTAQPRTTVNSTRPMKNVFNKAHSTVRMPINNKTSTKNSNFNQKVNNTRPKAVVNAARPKAVLNAVKGNRFHAVKASACWVWKPKNRVIDHVSKHNSASITLKKFDYIDAQGRSHYEEIDEGYVAFGGNPKGGKITGRDVWNGIGVNTGDSRLMLLGINLLLLVKVNAARHKLTTTGETFLSKPTECEGFEQIINFWNAHTIQYALIVNPTIFVSCIEQFWTTGVVKKINGETQIHALVDGKRVIQLTLMGYEKITQKLTFYKAFFSPQWKFLIHTVLQCLSAKTTTWNEFSSTMASAIICLATNQKFNFLKFIFEDEAVYEEMEDSLVRATTTATSLDAE
ncbi:hypothetical protein Tco_0226846 [Tanacetum coccineum]